MPKTVADLLAERLGIRTTVFTNRVTTFVATTPKLIARQDPNRPLLTIVNTSTEDIFVAPIPGVGAQTGIRLTPNGGSVSVWWGEDGIMVTREWYGISLVGAATIFVIEDIIQPDKAE